MDLKNLHEQVLFSQVRVKTDKAGGSGTIIYSKPNDKSEFNTFAISCAHVIDDAIQVKKEWSSKLGIEKKREYRQVVTVEFFDYSNVPHGNRPVNYSVDAEIVAYDKDHDMALLKLRTVKPAAYIATFMKPGDEKALVVGSPTVAVGAALLHDPIVTSGVITHMGDEIDYKTYWMSNAQIIFGNCIPGEEKVFTTRGPKPIKDIRNGDLVYSLSTDGKNQWVISRVARTINSGYKPVFEIKTNTRTIRASSSHPFLTPTGWQLLDALKPGDEIGVLCDALDGSEHLDKDWLWLVGLFLGDGMYRDRGHRDGYDVNFSVFNELADETVQALKRLGYEAYIDKTRGVFVKQPKALIDALIQHGIVTGSHEKRLPGWIFGLNTEGKLSIIEGLLDSDGHVDKRGDWRFELNNHELLEDIRHLAMAAGKRVSNVHERTRPWQITNQVGRTYEGESTSWSFVIFNQGLEKSRLYRDGLYDRIKSIEAAGVKETFDLEIEGTHNFVANGVVVHNSGGAMFADTERGYEFIGIPSRVAVAGWSGPVTHLGYFSPISRVYEFLDEQSFHFLIPGHPHTEAECAVEIKQARDMAEKILANTD